MDHRTYYTYIMASRSHTLYTGITSKLEQRTIDHKNKTHKGFSATYNCNRLVWYETYSAPGTAIAREKQIKGWTRAKKLALIKSQNPTWIDLSEPWANP